jgi:hypothetical protein
VRNGAARRARSQGLSPGEEGGLGARSRGSWGPDERWSEMLLDVKSSVLDRVDSLECGLARGVVSEFCFVAYARGLVVAGGINSFWTGDVTISGGAGETVPDGRDAPMTRVASTLQEAMRRKEEEKRSLVFSQCGRSRSTWARSDSMKARTHSFAGCLWCCICCFQCFLLFR